MARPGKQFCDDRECLDAERQSFLERPDDVIEMPEFGLRCMVNDLYRGTPLDP
jgi:hypothetical protein